LEVVSMEIQWPERIPLAHLPTPIHELPALTREIGRPVFVKRDDLTECGASGNKIRKLEFLLAQAKSAGADTVVTIGGLQSNHCRATAVAARMCGMHPHLILRGERQDPPGGNFFLDVLLGATFTFVKPEEYASGQETLIEEAMERLRKEGRAPFPIPVGGSNALGALGYVVCAREIADHQAKTGVRFARIYHASGSGGTTSGLLLGAAAFGLEAEILGVNVGEERAPFEAAIRSIIDEARTRFRITEAVGDAGVAEAIVDGYAGEGYGKMDKALVLTLAETARKTGMLLDPVYTGKAMQGLEGEEAKRDDHLPVLFIHTGGIFGLMAEAASILLPPP